MTKPKNKAVKQVLKQQVHAADNGEIVLVADKTKSWQLACKKCQALWIIQSPFTPLGELPKDFKPYKP